MSELLRPSSSFVSLSERTVVNTEQFCYFAVREIVSSFKRFEKFNHFLNRFHIGGVESWFVWVVVLLGCDIARAKTVQYPCA